MPILNHEGENANPILYRQLFFFFFPASGLSEQFGIHLVCGVGLNGTGIYHPVTHAFAIPNSLQ